MIGHRSALATDPSRSKLGHSISRNEALLGTTYRTEWDVIMNWKSDSRSSDSVQAPLASEPIVSVGSVTTIPYETVEEWQAGRDGIGRAIVVRPDFRNVERLRTLGAQLANETRQSQFAIVMIYDKADAARMRRAALGERLSKADMALYDEHMRGSYTRNGRTGFHAITAMPDGVKGPSTQIPLPRQ